MEQTIIREEKVLNHREFFIQKIIEKTNLKRKDFIEINFFELKNQYERLYNV